MATVTRAAPGRMSRAAVRNTITGVLFISPWIAGFLIFTVYPIGASFFYSFTDYTVLNPRFNFVGGENYQDLFTTDPNFWRSVFNTVYFAGVSVPLNLVLGISLALILNMKVRGLAMYRTVYYLPNLVPAVSASVLWAWILNPQFGLINMMIEGGARSLGFGQIVGPGWLSDPMWSKPALIVMNTWGAGVAVIIYLAALQDIPEHLYEAAEIDGAGVARKLWHITLPLLTPAIFFNLVINLIATFQYFTQAYVIYQGQGGPLDSALFYAMQLYIQAFQYFKMGYASAMAWLLFMVVVGVTLGVFVTSGRWVFYMGGDRESD